MNHRQGEKQVTEQGRRLPFRSSKTGKSKTTKQLYSSKEKEGAHVHGSQDGQNDGAGDGQGRWATASVPTAGTSNSGPL